MRIFLIILLLFGCNQAYSQQAKLLERIYVDETIYRQGGQFVKGTERLKFSDLKYEFSRSEAAAGLYVKARQSRNFSTALQIASAGLFLVLGPVASSSGDAATVWVLGGAVGTGIASRYAKNRSADYLDRALWQRNRDVLFK